MLESYNVAVGVLIECLKLPPLISQHLTCARPVHAKKRNVRAINKLDNINWSFPVQGIFLGTICLFYAVQSFTKFQNARFFQWEIVRFCMHALTWKLNHPSAILKLVMGCQPLDSYHLLLSQRHIFVCWQHKDGDILFGFLLLLVIYSQNI